MSSSQRVESGELNPSSTHFVFFLLSEETAHISPYMRDAKHVHVHHACNGVGQVPPITPVVTQPMGSVLASGGEGAASENEGPLVRSGGGLVQVLVGALGHHVPVETVHVVLLLMVKAGKGSVKGESHVVVIAGVGVGSVVRGVVARDEGQLEGARLVLAFEVVVPGV